ncbi:phosphohydrolase, partial [Patescibacteria group bacterium]|nr:phosphohydrolase [Patescibacteria group bacterium]
MKLDHRVYGEIEISEPVIIELINCPALQRLKEIDQAGYFEPHYPGSSQTRFEHSIGDYHLLTKYEASLEERIAGLIHDVSH